MTLDRPYGAIEAPFVPLHELPATVSRLLETPGLTSQLPPLLDVVRSSTGFDVAHLYLRHGAGEALDPAGVWSLSDAERFQPFQNAIASLRLFPGMGLAGRVLLTGRVHWLPALAADPNFPPAPVASAVGLHSGVGVPLTGSAIVHGVLELFSLEPRVPEPVLLEVLGSVGRLLGNGFERA